MVRLTRKTAFRVGGAALLLVLLALFFRPTTLPVDLGRVTTGPLLVTVDAEGQTRVRDRYTVSAPIAGRLLRPAYRAGDSVTVGAVVARVEPAPLDPRAATQALTRIRSAEDAERVAEAGVVAARAALEQASRLRQRAETLSAKGLLAPEEREKLELAELTRARELEAAEFRAQAAGHDAETARAAMIAASGGRTDSPYVIRAPVSGRVLRVMEESERIVAAGTPVLEVGNPTTIEVVADLLSADAVQVTPGDTIMVEAWGGSDALRARVRTVEPSGFTKVSALGVEEQRVNVVGDFIDSPSRLGDRYRVEVRVVIWQSTRVLKLPVSALIRHGGGWAVFAVVGGKARLTLVEIGHRGTSEAEVLKGVAEGSEVILHPSDRITDGVRVRRATAG